MSEARKMMNNAETIHISEEDKKAAMELLKKAPTVSVEDAIHQYKSDLDHYCEKYNISDHQELMAKADELSFEPKECFDILDKYSFIVRHQS